MSTATIDFTKTTAMEIDRNDRCIIKTVEPENIFKFPNGIIGFENIQQYYFLINEKVKPFMFMQAIEDPSLCFVCIETFIVCPDYNIKLDEKTVDFLKIETPRDVFVLSLVTVRKQVEEITANLMSPLIINVRNSLAQQVILENCEYPVRYKIWEALENNNLKMYNAG